MSCLTTLPERPRVVIDTGVLIGRMVQPQSVPAQAIEIAYAIGVLLVSAETLTEFADVLGRPKFSEYFKAEDAYAIVEAYAANAEMVAATVAVKACSDPNDDKFLALALSGKADVIVTGDSDLLALNPFSGVAILTPRAFVGFYASNAEELGGLK